MAVFQKQFYGTKMVKSEIEYNLKQYTEHVLTEGTVEEKVKQNRLDIRGYMKYILEKGALEEKRELMQSFKSKLMLIDKRVILE